jgi:uncharacterized repeat protein (TIGR03943 family)
MNKNQYRFIQIMITSGMAAVLTERLLDGRLSFFINMRFAPLTLAAIAILLVVSGIGALDIEKKLDANNPENKTSSQKLRQFLFLPFLPFFASLMGMSAPVYTSIFCLAFITGFIRLAYEGMGDQAVTAEAPGSWWNLSFLAIPLIILIVVPGKPLSTGALSTRGINMSSPAALGKQSPTTIKAEPTDRTILDWVTIFDSEVEATKYLGSNVSVIGFVYHDNRLPKHQVMVGRFTITCCVADAFAVGMVVDSPDTEKFSNDSWVKVDGTLDEITMGGVKVPLIHATSITGIEPPAQPYLYP